MRMAVALLFCALLVGCATQRVDPASQIEPDARRIYLVVRPSPDIARSADWAAFRDEWRDQIAHGAEQDKRHFTMLDAEPPSDTPHGTLIAIYINDYRFIHAAARVLFGIMTGNAFIQGSASIYEYPGRQGRGTVPLNVSSSAWGGVASAMTGRQVATLTSDIFGQINRRETRAVAGAPSVWKESGGVMIQQPNNTVTIAPVADRGGPDRYQAEQFVRSAGCQAHPTINLVHRAPGMETYSANCTNGSALVVQCQYGNCRAMK